MAKELRVLVAEEAIGSIVQLAHGSLKFIYDDSWRARVDPYPLSLSMPLTLKEHDNKQISNFLWGLLTDDDRARGEMARRRNISSRSVFALVANYGDDLPGAVQIEKPEDVSALAGREGIRGISEKRLAAFLANLVAHPGQTQINEDAGFFSLAGVQPKKAICWVGGRWYEPKGRTPSTHIN